MSLAVLDWRRRTAQLYREVREAADAETGFDRWRAGRQELFARHPASPDRAARLRYGRYAPELRFEVEVVDPGDPERLEIATGTDGIVPFVRIGRVEIPSVGALDVWWLDSYGGGVWLPLRDASPETYGGGRYLLDTVKGADLGGEPGRLVVDLNFAYNPSCAYAEHWACPLAPPGNTVSMPLAVGELLPQGSQ